MVTELPPAATSPSFYNSVMPENSSTPMIGNSSPMLSNTPSMLSNTTSMMGDSSSMSGNSSPMMNESPPMFRYRRSFSRTPSTSFSEPSDTVNIRGQATLCFDEEGTSFLGVIAADDRSHYSIQGRKTPRRKASAGKSSCGCVETEEEENNEELGVPVSFDIRIKDHDNPMEYRLRRVHGRNGQVCKFTCSNISFTSLQVYRGHKADMIAQESLGHKTEGGRSQVYCGPINVTVEAREEPRHWVL